MLNPPLITLPQSRAPNVTAAMAPFLIEDVAAEAMPHEHSGFEALGVFVVSIGVSIDSMRELF